MKLTLEEALEAIQRRETPEQYIRRMRRVKRLSNERYDIEDALAVLTEPEDKERAEKKRKRLNKVLAMLDELGA